MTDELKQKTWRDIDLLARDNPIVHQCLRGMFHGAFSSEQALITMVCALADSNEQYKERLLHELNTHLPERFVGRES